MVRDPGGQHLATWRMQLAKQMMREAAHNIQEVATRVGSPPATWRKSALAANVLSVVGYFGALFV